MDNKLFTEAGFLSDKGKLVFKELLDNKIRTLLLNGDNESEIRLIGSLIMQRVGCLITETVTDKS